MLSLEVSYKGEFLNRVTSAIEATPKLIQQVVRSHVHPRVARYVDENLRRYPGPIRPGVFKRTATPKQLRYVMAKIRRGEWTGRTGALGRAWIVLIDDYSDGAAVLVRNTSSIATYVVGNRQQVFHADTGWPVTFAHAPSVNAIAHIAFEEGYFDAVSGQTRTR